MIRHNTHKNIPVDIQVILYSQSPAEQVLTINLVGRDRNSRLLKICDTRDDLEDVSSLLHPDKESVIIIDYGYHSDYNLIFREHIRKMLDRYNVRIIGLLDRDNLDVEKIIRANYLDAIVIKDELGPGVHILARACFMTDKLIITSSLEPIVAVSSPREYGIIRSMRSLISDLRKCFSLTEKQANIFVLKIVAGLTPMDIQDEKNISQSTYGKHVGKIYEHLRDSEITDAEKVPEVFREFSEWMWEERFLSYI